MNFVEHSWLPVTSCTEACVRSGLGDQGRPAAAAVRAAVRLTAAAVVLAAMPVLAVPLPGFRRLRRRYCRTVLRCLGVRMTVTGGPIRNHAGMLVVSNHTSWVDVFVIGAVLPGSFVARADLFEWPGVGVAARLANVIPIERRSLRGLPAVVNAVLHRLRDGNTVVAFPEGTTFCGPDSGRFRPALFEAAIRAGRPVQPLRLTYHHGDGSASTATAFLGEDSLWASITRTVRARSTRVRVSVAPLELSCVSRRELAARCEAAVHHRTEMAPTRRAA